MRENGYDAWRRLAAGDDEKCVLALRSRVGQLQNTGMYIFCRVSHKMNLIFDQGYSIAAVLHDDQGEVVCRGSQAFLNAQNDRLFEAQTETNRVCFFELFVRYILRI